MRKKLALTLWSFKNSGWASMNLSGCFGSAQSPDT